jgi:hypothetical protein
VEGWAYLEVNFSCQVFDISAVGNEEEGSKRRDSKVGFGDCGDTTCLPDAALCIVGGIRVLESVVLVFDFVISAAEKTSYLIL